MTNHKQFSGFFREIIKNYPSQESVNVLFSLWGEREAGLLVSGCLSPTLP